jgi:hypothetical protein
MCGETAAGNILGEKDKVHCVNAQFDPGSGDRSSMHMANGKSENFALQLPNPKGTFYGSFSVFISRNHPSRLILL